MSGFSDNGRYPKGPNWGAGVVVVPNVVPNPCQ